ncbi:uncharacterized protein LOC125831472 [Solanum verrucosum]|uniref:uncharacterized protein LOC125831472 n=1 Tax=Solanum verrucosum TaxID=315347 RepID=UPI0020D0D1BA|nr:uncharacterized protein LOC125831472 [Solanum verrucosum]
MVDQQVDPIPSGSTSTVRIEIPSPFYLHPSENAGSFLLPGVFDGTGYRSWRRAVLRALSVKSKTDLRDSLQYVNNAQELWAELEERYYTKMKKLWEEMSTVDVSSQCSCVCTCGGKIRLVKVEQDRRLIQFLMGLNEMYTVIRGNILMMSTLPSMAQAFAILSQEEKQREVRPHNHTALDSTSLNALASSTGSKGGPRTNYNSSKWSTGVSGNLNNTNVFRGNSSTSRSSLFCDFCRRTGHTRERCYKLHGYPSNSKFTKGKSVGSAANMCTSENDRNHCEEDPELRKQMPLNLSKDQYEQLLNLLGSLQVGHGAPNSDNMLSGAVNLAGPFSEEPSGTW